MTTTERELRLTCGAELGDTATAAHALPGDTAVWTRDRAVAVQHIDVALRLDVATKSIDGQVTHTVRPMNDGLARVQFDACEMTILAATVDGEDARHSYDGILQAGYYANSSTYRGHTTDGSFIDYYSYRDSNGISSGAAQPSCRHAYGGRPEPSGADSRLGAGPS